MAWVRWCLGPFPTINAHSMFSLGQRGEARKTPFLVSDGVSYLGTLLSYLSGYAFCLIGGLVQLNIQTTHFLLSVVYNLRCNSL